MKIAQKTTKYTVELLAELDIDYKIAYIIGSFPLRFTQAGTNRRFPMRLITRADLDGVVCAVMITQMENIEQVLYAQPQDIEDGTVPVHPGDAVANLSWHHNVGLWFDHHDRAQHNEVHPGVKGKWGEAPSAARLVYEYYNSPRLQKFAGVIDETDRYDSAHLTVEDVLNPKGWVLLGLTLDPYMGLAAFTGYANLVAASIRMGSPVEQILDSSEVKARVHLYHKDAEEFKSELRRLSRVEGNVIITDAREEFVMPVGNRFLIFALYPDATIQLSLTHHSSKSKVRVRVSKSIINRNSKLHLGDLMAEYGGGGLDGAAGCLLDWEEAQPKLDEILAKLKAG
jgi:hypothetical protein